MERFKLAIQQHSLKTVLKGGTFHERRWGMFLKLTEADSAMDVYVNPLHIIRFVPNFGDEDGTLIFLAPGAGIGGPHEPQILMVQEHAEEVFRMISRSEKPTRASAGGGGANRGFI